MYLPHLTPARIAVIVILVIAALIPSVIILRRLGFSGWWAIIAPISPLNFDRPLGPRFRPLARGKHDQVLIADL